MPKEIMFKPNTPVSMLLKIYQQRQMQLCIPPEKLTDALSSPWRVRYADKTFGEMVDGGQDADYKPWFGIWFIYTFGEEIDPSLRKKIFASSVKDSMTAFQVYLRCRWLTDEEDKLLEAMFKGKLPTAETELEKGIVTRAKWQ